MLPIVRSTERPKRAKKEQRIAPPMTLDDCKAAFSNAYVRAVAATAACSTQHGSEPDRDGVDLTLRKMFTTGVTRRAQVEVQLKCTETDIFRDGGDRVAFELTSEQYETYNSPGVTPLILVVMHVPEVTGDWLGESDEELALRRCAYWVPMDSPLASDDGRRSITVSTASVNRFTSDALTTIMATINANPFGRIA